MNKGRLKLSKYYEKKGDITKIAQILGFQRETVSMILSGKRLPTLTQAIRIQNRYDIPCSDWEEE
jgi:plasmid maintenance system antidote protein VapI